MLWRSYARKALELGGEFTKMSKVFLYLALILSVHIYAEDKPYLVMHCRDGAGLFSIWHDVLCMTKCYEKGLYTGIEVDFKREGQYYDERYGDNWWEYYCYPIKQGYADNNVRHVMGDPPGSIGCEIEYFTPRQEARDLIGKYIHLKTEISTYISDFQRANFNGYYVISVHYRGTDKCVEVPTVPYDEMRLHIEDAINRYPGENYKIFIATDEQEFLDYMTSLYGDRICFNPQAIRSTDGQALHMGDYDRYQCGFDAIVDSVLLSRGNFLIRMSSNLSRWSLFFNPDIPFIEINAPNQHGQYENTKG